MQPKNLDPDQNAIDTCPCFLLATVNACTYVLLCTHVLTQPSLFIAHIHTRTPHHTYSHTCAHLRDDAVHGVGPPGGLGGHLDDLACEAVVPGLHGVHVLPRKQPAHVFVGGTLSEWW